MSTNAKRPTFEEDVSLAKNGDIRMPDGEIRRVGRKQAFQMVDERERSGIYEASKVDPDIIWKRKADESVGVPESKLEPITKTETEIEDEQKEEPIDVSKSQPGDPGFVRGRVIVSRTNLKPGQPRTRYNEPDESAN